MDSIILEETQYIMDTLFNSRGQTTLLNQQLTFARILSNNSFSLHAPATSKISATYIFWRKEKAGRGKRGKARAKEGSNLVGTDSEQ
ncbi:hypothetical protein NQ317_012938 [Molorchus minor]|uniref:Uncharacterized protein n=1 Tax=Molorchus minor TaxID=1323400 RepID=A0ABQ9J0W1_9CUCU|nr:hypothetical protein NQ317_012938 [Molorchus minor]